MLCPYAARPKSPGDDVVLAALTCLTCIRAQKKYLHTGSIKPVVHVMLSVGVIGYWLQYPNLKREMKGWRVGSVGRSHARAPPCR